MYITKQMLDSGMPVKCAGSGTTAMSIVALAGAGLLAVHPNIFRGIFNGDDSKGHGNNCGGGHHSGVNPNFYCQVTELKDELYYCQSTKYTDHQVNKLEEKVELMIAPLDKRITKLEVQNAVNCQRDQDSLYYGNIISAKNERINQLENDTFVKKQTSTPPGQHLVDCCRPCHPFELNANVAIQKDAFIKAS